jgi:hypothetical protein
MKLGIFGDSYTHVPEHRQRDKSRKDYSWTEIVGSQYKVVKNYSMSATSIWWSFNNFLNNFDKFNTIIFCYSSHLRWFHFKEGFEILSNIGTHGKDVIPNMQGWSEEHKKVANILIDAQEYIFSEELQRYVYQKIFNDVNKICQNNNIKLINLLPFENIDTLISLDQRSGCCITSLHVSSLKETMTGKPNAEQLTFNLRNGKTHDPRFNHLNENNNKVLAKCVLENIDTNNIIDFSKLSSLSYSDELLSYNYDCY